MVRFLSILAASNYSESMWMLLGALIVEQQKYCHI